MFNSKKLSLLSVISLVVSSLTIGGLGVSSATAAIPDTFTTLQINGTDVDVVDSAATVNLPSGTTSATLNAVSADVQYLEGTLNGAALNTVASASGFRSFTINDTLNLSQGDQSLVLRTSDDNNHATTTSLVTITLHVDPQYSDITVNGSSVTAGSTVNLDANTASATVGLSLSDPAATVVFGSSPTATKAADSNTWTVSGLVAGDNTVSFSITNSAAGSLTATYTLNLSVAVSTDAGASVSVNGVDRAEGEDIYVPYGTTSVAVVVTTSDANASYFVDGDLGLETGDNDLVVTVTAADGTTIYDYHYNVVVMENTDTSVNSITVNGESVVDGSTLILDPLTTEVDVQVDTRDVDATYVIEGDTDLVTGDNQLMITVTAADGETDQQYFVLLTVLPNTDASLASVTINGNEISENDYFHVDPLTTDVDVLAVPTDENATYEVTGGTDLMPGENDLSILVTAADGETTYTFFATIVVDPNTVTDVESISVNGESVEDGGTVYLAPFTDSVDVEVTTTDPDATYVVDGDTGLSVGDNTLTIFVTAADGLTTRDYVVTLVVALSNNADVEAINVTYAGPDGDQTVEVVDGDTLDLPSNTDSVDVEVTTADGEATYEVSGNTGLSVGENEMTITVTAPDGETSQDIYVTLNVAVGDVTTSSFTVNGEEVSAGDVVDLEPGTESVDVAVVTTDPNATYEITGGDSLVLGANTLTLAVTSVDETLTVEYTVTLNVLPSSDAGITGIDVNGNAWEDGVPVEVDAGDLDVQVSTSNEFATVEVTGNTTNVSGIQELTVTVTAQDGETTSEATIIVVASSDVQVVSGSSLTDGQLRVDSWIKLPRTQFEKTAKLQYFWVRDLDASPIASGPKYKLTTDDYGHDLRAVILVSKAGQPTRTVLSRKIDVAPGLIAKAPVPTLKGKALVGNTLTAATKAWIDGVDLSYQWYRDGAAIEGATSETYDLTPDDLGAAITVGITGTMEAYEPLEKLSNPLTVAPGTLKYTDKPTISGSFVTGGTVEVNPGSWIETAQVSISWQRNGEEFNVTSGEDNSYVLTSDDYGTKFGVNILVSAPGYNDRVFKIKARTIKIGTLANPPVPTISGSGLVGESLDADAGEYPDGATFTYVWKRDGRVIANSNDSSYTVTTKDAGKLITVKVIAKIPGYKTVRVESDGIQALNAQ